MKQTVKYAAILACIAFLIMIVPGAILIACGYNLLVASFGVALGVILCCKGNIARKIFGSDQNHKSTPTLALAVFIFTGFKAVTSIMTSIAEARLFGVAEYDSAHMYGQYTFVVVASIIWSAIVFASVLGCSFIRSWVSVKDNQTETQL